LAELSGNEVSGDWPVTSLQVVCVSLLLVTGRASVTPSPRDAARGLHVHTFDRSIRLPIVDDVESDDLNAAVTRPEAVSSIDMCCVVGARVELAIVLLGDLA
jgi:hypothetical protein